METKFGVLLVFVLCAGVIASAPKYSILEYLDMFCSTCERSPENDFCTKYCSLDTNLPPAGKEKVDCEKEENGATPGAITTTSSPPKELSLDIKKPPTNMFETRGKEHQKPSSYREAVNPSVTFEEASSGCHSFRECTEDDCHNPECLSVCKPYCFWYKQNDELTKLFRQLSKNAPDSKESMEKEPKRKTSNLQCLKCMHSKCREPDCYSICPSFCKKGNGIRQKVEGPKKTISISEACWHCLENHCQLSPCPSVCPQFCGHESQFHRIKYSKRHYGDDSKNTSTEASTPSPSKREEANQRSSEDIKERIRRILKNKFFNVTNSPGFGPYL